MVETFYSKFAGFQPATLPKKVPITGVFLQALQSFLEQLFYTSGQLLLYIDILKVMK